MKPKINCEFGCQKRVEMNMEDVRFTSSLSEEEIAKNFENIDFFSGIMAGLEEALAYEKGTAKAATIVQESCLPAIDSVKCGNP